MTIDNASISKFESESLSLLGQKEQAQGMVFQESLAGRADMLKGNISQALSHFGKADDGTGMVSTLDSEIKAAGAMRDTAVKESVAAEAAEKSKEEANLKLLDPASCYVDPKKPQIAVCPGATDEKKVLGSGTVDPKEQSPVDKNKVIETDKKVIGSGTVSQTTTDTTKVNATTKQANAAD